MKSTSTLQVAIVQRFLMHYRLPLLRQINQLDGIDLTVIVNDPKTLDWNKEELGFKLVYLPSMIVDFGYKDKNYRIPLGFSFIKHLWKANYDVVISEGVTNIVNNLMIYPMVHLRRGKYIWWGAGRRRFAKKNIFRRMVDPFAHYMIKHADANIAYGSVSREYMISVGADPQKVFIAQNTIDTTTIFTSLDKLSPQIQNIREVLDLKDKKIILYVGVIEKRKRVENLILAYQALLKEANQPMALIIVGDGPYLEKLKYWYENKMPELEVHFMGKIVDQVGAYFAMCDVFVLPSEGGLALNQAMSYGKPIVATSADGTEVDLIRQDENGYIVAEEDIDALKAAVLRIIASPQKQIEMGNFSLQLMKEKFTLDNMVNGFVLSIKKTQEFKIDSIYQN